MSRKALRLRQLLFVPLIFIPAVCVIVFMPEWRLAAMLTMLIALVLGVATNPLVRRGHQPVVIAIVVSAIAYSLGFWGQGVIHSDARARVLDNPPERLDSPSVRTLHRMGATTPDFLDELTRLIFERARAQEDMATILHLTHEISKRGVATPSDLRWAARKFEDERPPAAVIYYEALLAHSDDPSDHTLAWRNLLRHHPDRVNTIHNEAFGWWRAHDVFEVLTADQLDDRLSLHYRIARMIDHPSVWTEAHRQLGQAASVIGVPSLDLLNELRHFASHEREELWQHVDVRTVFPVLDALVESGDAAAVYRLTSHYMYGAHGRRLEQWRAAAGQIAGQGVRLRVDGPEGCEIVVSGRSRGVVPVEFTASPGSHVFACAQRPRERERHVIAPGERANLVVLTSDEEASPVW